MSRILAAAVALAACLSLAAPLRGAADDEQAPPTELAGVDVSALTPAQQEVLRKVLADEFCYCGCPHTLGGCLREHKGCHHAPRMAQLAARLAAKGAPAADVERLLRTYYGGFDKGKRARLDVKDFGPPLGDPKAPVTIVEFSDFTCPFCQRVKPAIDQFVRDHPGQVKLFYKPFPIASHPHAMEAAIAVEWARDKGLFWKMYDELFAHAHELTESDLAGYAEAIGGDPDDLRRALESGRNKARITGAQAEGRAAGMTGTPTFYLNGHKLELPYGDDFQEVFQFALDDELEWAKHGGWERD